MKYPFGIGMIRFLLILVGFVFLTGLNSLALGETKSSYWVQFRDKAGTPFQVIHPEAFLSQRALDRRNRQHIPIDETDLPVSPLYLDSLQKLGLELVHTSKWLNGATFRTADTSLLRQIELLSFVALVELTRPANELKSANTKFTEEARNTTYDPIQYGNSQTQLTQLNGQFLHSQGFRGKGIQIAVLDAGFWHVNQIAAFDSLRQSNRILGTRDFVDPKADIYQQNWHGMSVLSCMGGNSPGTLIGTAPDASYYLFRTEQDPTEYLIEEDNWVAGAELADSLGVDVINSSLGYYQFDDPKMSHIYADMNGSETRVTQGANMAFRKGILVFSSAGNEGTNSWKYIISPSDGENVIGVGAVNKIGTRASFSSVGPAYGGAIKPNVAAMGSATYLINNLGVPGYLNGTSFSSPVLAGMGACLLQANPFANVLQIKMALEQSAHQFALPDSLLGYGIPDFEKADQYLKLNSIQPLASVNSWQISPNPFIDKLSLRNLNFTSEDDCMIRIMNLQGVCVWQANFRTGPTILLNNLAKLPDGLLILSIRSGEKEERFKLLKIK